MKKAVKSKARPEPRIPGTVYVNVRLPESLHGAIKTIARQRRDEQQEHVKLCVVYREAIEQYVRHPRQKRLLDLKAPRDSG